MVAIAPALPRSGLCRGGVVDLRGVALATFRARRRGSTRRRRRRRDLWRPGRRACRRLISEFSIAANFPAKRWRYARASAARAAAGVREVEW